MRETLEIRRTCSSIMNKYSQAKLKQHASDLVCYETMAKSNYSLENVGKISLSSSVDEGFI
jgi:hypothetical protein